MSSKPAGGGGVKASQQTMRQIEQLMKEIASKYPADNGSQALTDIHLRVEQDSGCVTAFDDDGEEMAHCVVRQWADSEPDDLYDTVAAVLRKEIGRLSDATSRLGIVKPYSFVLETAEKERVAELYTAADNPFIVGGDLMPGLDKELDSFLKKTAAQLTWHTRTASKTHT